MAMQGPSTPGERYRSRGGCLVSNLKVVGDIDSQLCGSWLQQLCVANWIQEERRSAKQGDQTKCLVDRGRTVSGQVWRKESRCSQDPPTLLVLSFLPLFRFPDSRFDPALEPEPESQKS